ncbi:short-subunit dehydrogenase [Knoellia remsis]|uniref:Short-subunit dehydrogenase n=1 Tax=Knoellia remsis TaxID=407159 RepID=A0A2T0UGL5_9MICO|nr:oxidoreductase [Knoellia remsis]PRY57091.1 short-subunit dehydrogenase [Knoellia remsis]
MSKVAIVTGASSGIGAATARRLARGGFTVYGAARRADRLAELESDGVRALPLDLTDDASIVAAVDRVLADEGRIDVLVNNAGYGSYGAVEDVPMDEARRQFEVNVFGLARIAQLVMPTMRAQGSGRIVNITSMGGRFATAFGGWYHATKFAVEGLSDSMRQELAPFGVDVVVVEPGAIRTEWTGIAAQSAVDQSGEGAYAKRAKRLSRSFGGGESLGSDPDVVARTIERAVTAKKPRTRYAVGRGAKPAIAASKVLPDRAFDAILGRALG